MQYRGIPVSPGFATGNVFIYKPFVPKITEKTIDKNAAETARAQYFDMREKARDQLLAVKDELLTRGDTEKAKIFEGQIAMLFDVSMNNEIEKHIVSNCFSPEVAIEKTYSKFIVIFSKAKNEQIRERAADLNDLRLRLHRIWFDVPEKDLSSLETEVIIAAHDLYPSDTARLDTTKVQAIITEVGGSTSHTAIIARSYEIPCILGIKDVMDKLKDGEPVIVDAVEGVLHTSPDERTLSEYEKKREEYIIEASEVKQYLGVKPITKDGVCIEINLNIGSVSQDELSGSLHTDGVGLFRTEFMYMAASSALPTEEEQYLVYRKVALEFGERPVINRTLDIGGDKQLDCFELPKEDNPFLGLRALRLCMENPALFKPQLRAIFRAACHGNLWLMLPMVGSIDDIRSAKAVIEEVKEELCKEGKEYNENVPIGIMIEIPAIAMIAEIAAREVDFASIGTNDLCQYLVAVDRLNPAVSKYYQSFHPAMLRLIAHTISAFNEADKPISVCGEMGGDPHSVAVLIGLGMRKFSMAISSVPRVKKMITELSIPQAKALAERVMACTTANEVEQCLTQEFSEMS